MIKELREMVDKLTVRKVGLSWCLQSRAERKARLQAVTELSIELAAIKAKNIFATGLGEGVIEYIIEGDWDYAAEAIEDFSWADDERLRTEYAPLWEFVILGRTFCAEHRRNFRSTV